MARIYIAVPVDPDHAEEALGEALSGYRESSREAAAKGYTGPPRIIRLRDRTGPNVAERLAAVEADLLDLRTRVGDLERLPVASGAEVASAERDRLFLLRDRAACGCLFADCTKHGAFGYRTEAERLEAEAIAEEHRNGALPVASPPATTEPTPEQIKAYLRGSAEWAQHPSVDRLWDHERSGGSIDITDRGLFKSVCAVESRTPAEMRARILAASATAEDPDRLAKVAEPTDEELGQLAISKWASSHRDVALEWQLLRPGDRVAWSAVGRALYNLGREHGRAERAALLARAEKAELELADRRAARTDLRVREMPKARTT